MRKLFFTVFTLFLIGCSSEDRYKILGESTSAYEGKEVYLYSLSHQTHIDTAVIKNGKFTFEGKLLQEQIVSISTLAHNINQMVLEQGEIIVKLQDKTADGVVSGTALNDTLAIYNSRVAKQVNNIGKADSNTIKELRESLVKNNIGNVLGAYFYQPLDKSFEDIELFMLENKYAKNNILLTRIIEGMHNRKKMVEGAKFVDFSAKNRSNTTDVKLSNYVGKGNYALVNFWLTNSAPCSAQMPIIRQIRDKYAQNGLIVVGVNISGAHANINSEISRYGINWLQIIDSTEHQVKTLYGINNAPESLLIDPNGIIIMRSVDAAEIDKFIQENIPALL